MPTTEQAEKLYQNKERLLLVYLRRLFATTVNRHFNPPLLPVHILNLNFPLPLLTHRSVAHRGSTDRHCIRILLSGHCETVLLPDLCVKRI